MLNYPYFKINQGFVEINGERVDSIKEMNVNYVPERKGKAEITIKLDAKVDIEGIAEIKQENKVINKAVLEYETSNGLKTIEFKSANDIENYMDGNVIYIDERKEHKLIKELATISSESFVSFRVEKIKED